MAQKRRSRTQGHKNTEQGAALLLTFVMMLVLSALALAVGVGAQNSASTARSIQADRLASYVSEAGWQRARQALGAGTWMAAASPGNSYTESVTATDGTTVLGQYQVTLVDNGGGEYQITSDGYAPNTTTYTARREIAEYQVAVTSSNGTNQSLTATASTSSSNASHLSSSAKDGNTSTYWKANVNGSGWLAMDLGSAMTLDKIIVKENSNITGVSVEYSDDGSSWTTISGQSVIASPSPTWTATFTATSHRYFRASVSASSSKKPSVKEMECYDSSISSIGTGDMATQW